MGSHRNFWFFRDFSFLAGVAIIGLDDYHA
jgi:hypothetical protein